MAIRHHHLYCQRSSTWLTSWVMTSILVFKLSSSIRPFRQQRCREECEARGAQQSYSAINRVIFLLNTENGCRLKIQKLKRKLCLAALGLRTESAREPWNLLFSFVLFARAERGVKRDERFCGIPAEFGHRPREWPCRQNIYNAADNRNPLN